MPRIRIDAYTQHRLHDPEYFAELIARTGLTQETLAKRMGTSPRRLHHLSHGTREARYTEQVVLELLATSHNGDTRR